MKVVFKYCISGLFLLLPIFFAYLSELQAQVLQLNQSQTELILTEKSFETLCFKNTVSEIYSFDVKTNAGNFSQIRIEGYGYSKAIGSPQLPVIKKLIEVPKDARINIRIISQSFQDIQLDDFGITHPLFPAQPSVSKSDDPNQITFEYNPAAYIQNRFTESDLVTVVPLGEMRGLNLARLEISPVLYNPAENRLRVYDDLNVQITFEGVAVPDNYHFYETKNNRYFKSFSKLIFNYNDFQTDALLGSMTMTYIIVSDPMFEDALQPFIEWKTRKGFMVVEAYTNNPEVGSTKESIKAYLQNFYNSPPQDYNPQTFVLIVGDVAQVPSFAGTTGNHATDLYYCEYTGDHFPEAFYGRFSANNLAELQPQIDKTLEYEQYSFPDPSFLDEVVMVAGYDAYYGQTWGNGQVNYGTGNYFNASNGLSSHTYLQPEPTGANYAQQIRQNISNGVAFANYTAHCSAQGWSNPTFLINHVSSLSNAHKYPLMVGNCCTSVDFRVTCFGEQLLRAPQKGAIGYVGGSNNTYWNEDFWWGVGFEAVSINPTYNSENLGMYDRLFHNIEGITVNDWYLTQGQIPQAGNLAVSQSGSNREVYYWEIYHLMGDPSLMVYFSQGDDIYVSFSSLLVPGAASFTVNTSAYAYVAISRDGVLHGTALADENGIAEVIFDTPLIIPGTAEIVVTGQNLKPFIGQVNVIAPDGPYVLLQSHAINDQNGNGNGKADFGESITLDLVIKNLGTETAEYIMLVLLSNDEFVEITNNALMVQNIAPDEVLALDDIFNINISTGIPNGHKIEFQLDALRGEDVWSSSFTVTGNAPKFSIKGFSVLDAGGNNNGKLEPGETVGLSVMIENKGGSDALNVMGELLSMNEHITINGLQFPSFGDLVAGSFASATFEVTADEAFPSGQVVLFTLNLFASMGVSFQDHFSMIVGQIPVLIVDLDLNKSSAIKIFNDVSNLGVSAELTDVLPEDISRYSSVFVCLGVYNENYKLTATEGQILANYLNSGGMLYLEGGDTWFYDPQTAVHPMFGIQAISDGAGDLETITGVDGTFTSGMSFNYTGENNWIDRLVPQESAFAILKNQTPLYTCGIANEGENYKTVGVSFEYSGLNDESRSALLNAYLNFFNINGASVLSTSISADPSILCSGESTQINLIIYGGSGNYSFAWTHGEFLSDSTMQNPIATPDVSTLFAVTITDLVSGNQLSQNLMIEVLPVPVASTIVQIGENLVSSLQFGNQWFNDNGAIPGATAQIFKPSSEGNYYSRIVSSNGCASDTSNIIYYQPTYIDELLRQGSLRLYPNPSNGILNIDVLTQNSNSITINVLNNFGQNLYSESFSDLNRIGLNTVSIDLSHLESGVYLIKLQDVDRVITRKIILNK